MDSLSYGVYNKICVVFLFILILLTLFPINVSGSSSSQNFKIIICDGNNSTAKIGSDNEGYFNNDPDNFTGIDYEDIDEDDENMVSYDQLKLGQEADQYQYHYFSFYIIDDINDIEQIDITWKGYGGDSGRGEIPPQYGYSFWVKENDNFLKKDNGTSSSKNTINTQYVGDDIDKIINNNYLYCAVQSDYPHQWDEGIYSIIYSYYIEVNITYKQSVQYLDVSHQTQVTETEEFIVTVTSEGSPVENAKIGFAGSSYYTDSNGQATLVAPEVELDSQFGFSITKDGYEDNSSFIIVLNNDVDPELEISSLNFVDEETEFEITVTSEGSPVENVNVEFNSDVLPTDSTGKVFFTAPSVDIKTPYLISATKTGCIGATKTINIIDSAYVFISITCPSGSAIVSDTFDITWEKLGVFESSTIDIYYSTDMIDWNIIIEDLSSTTTSYSWNTIQLVDGYYYLKIVLNVDGAEITDQSEIFYINNAPADIKGWLTGFIYGKDTNKLLDDVLICTARNVDGEIILDNCENKVNQLGYNLTLDPGIQIIVTSKEGYKTNSTTVTIIENQETNLDIMLEKETDAQDYTDEQILFNYLIEDITTQGNAGAKIETDSNKITYYSDDLEISTIESGKNSYSFSIAAPDDIEDKYVFIEIGTDIFSDIYDIDDLKVEYDGELHTAANLFGSFSLLADKLVVLLIYVIYIFFFSYLLYSLSCFLCCFFFCFFLIFHST